MVGVSDHSSLIEWCKDAFLVQRIDEITLPFDEFNRVWKIFASTHSNQPSGDRNYFEVSFYIPSGQRVSPGYYELMINRDSEPIFLYKETPRCICDGWTLLSAPTGCKCGGFAAEQRAKKEAIEAKKRQEEREKEVVISNSSTRDFWGC
jgi:hypothetical protein